MRRHTLLGFLIVGLVLFFVGCDDSGGGETDSGDDLILDQPGDSGDIGDDTTPEICDASTPCSESTKVCDLDQGRCVDRCSEESCGDGEVCDSETGFCVEGNACTSTEECTLEGEVCDTCERQCVSDEGKAHCESDSNCFSDHFCEPCMGVCVPRKGICDPCTEHKECGQDADLCIDLVSASGGRFCGQTCATLLDCPDGYLCNANDSGISQCVPASGDCASPAECVEDKDCFGGNVVCNAGRCVPGCTLGGCSGDSVCEGGRCQAPCDQRAEPCVAPAECNPASGFCEIEGECASSYDCEEPETYCDLQQQRCVPGCQVDDDCKDAYKECVEDSCVKRGCKGAWSCAFEQVCEMESGDCQEAEGPHCDVCDPDQEDACGENNECVSLEDEDGNAMGDFCFVQCSTDPENICPQGYQCVELKDQDGNVQNEVCARDCTTDPWE